MVAMSSRDGVQWPGPLALLGGAEFLPGNEGHGRILVEAARALGDGRPAFVIATAAARQGPDAAVRTAVGWYGTLGLAVEELPLRGRGQANSDAIAARARTGRFFVFAGGDPGLVVSTLAGTPAWSAIRDAWRDGAVLAGSSAGAMALGEWTLIRARLPGDSRREARPAFGVVPSVAVIPHFETFGHRWVDSAAQSVRAVAGPRETVLLGIDERTAAIWRDGRWRAEGSGGVTVIRGSTAERFAAGATIEGLPDPTA
jgi:cyanophycinase